MPDVTNAQIIKFCNECIRPAADLYLQLYYLAKIAKDRSVALNATTLMPNDVTYLVKDGADANGNPVMTAADVYTFMGQLDAVRADLDASSGGKLNKLGAIATNPFPTSR